MSPITSNSQSDSTNSSSVKIPQAFLAFRDGWDETTIDNEPIRLFMEEDYIDDKNLNPFIDTFSHMVTSMSSALKSRGQAINCVNAFTYLLPVNVISKLSDATTQHLVAKDCDKIENDEYYEFIATKMLRSRHKVSTYQAFVKMKDESIKHGFDLMEYARYQSINNCTGYPTKSDELDRTKRTSKTWSQEKRKFRSFSEFERIFFERSVDTFLNKSNGKLVVDDELISSKSVDVELKCVSERKQGKEGPVSDCISCSLTSIMFGMRLRLKGDKQESNVLALLDHLPKLTNPSDSITIHFDRGYGKLNFITMIAQKNYDILTIAPNLGSRHPFILQNEVDSYVKKWTDSGQSPSDIAKKIHVFSKWIFNNNQFLGTNARVYL